MDKCVLCGDTLDTEHPQSILDINPETFRRGWMHNDCLEVALDTAKEQAPSSVEYQNRFDEYVTRFS